MIWQPFAVASIFHEFAGDATAVASGDLSRLGLPTGIAGGRLNVLQGGTSVATSVSRVGTYGHVGLGLAGVSLDSGWSGYARVDYREGDNIRGLNFNVGGRYQLAAPPSASSSLKDSAPTPAPAAKWGGAYLGLSGGGMMGHTNWSEQSQQTNDSLVLQAASLLGFTPPQVGGGQITPHWAGFIGSGQIGYNHQAGTTVLGVEADWGLSNARGGAGCPGLWSFTSGGGTMDRSAFFNCRVAMEQVGFLTARVGHAWDQTLFYIKGGLAFGQVESFSRFLSLNNRLNDRDVGETKWQVGWALGIGAEYSLSNRWSIKGEVLHFDLGTASFGTDSGSEVNRTVDRIIARNQSQGDIARVGINYRFGAN